MHEKFTIKKQFGQNFFTDRRLAEELTTRVIDGRDVNLLEIGPGKGAFTEYFYKNLRHRLYLVEIDEYLAKMMQVFYPQATVWNMDVLEDTFIQQLLNSKYAQNSDSTGKVVFGALPYNISKRIIMRMLENHIADEYWYIVQKEVGELLLENKCGMFKLFTQIYADSEKIKILSPHFFNPRPKVESMLIKITPHYKDENISDIPKLSRFIKTAFRMPRKTVKNNLAGTEFAAIADQNILSKRAEDLNLAEIVQALDITK